MMEMEFEMILMFAELQNHLAVIDALSKLRMDKKSCMLQEETLTQ